VEEEEEIEEGCVIEGESITVEVSTCPECKKSFITKENLDVCIPFAFPWCVFLKM
jgi:hypothetical protein